MYAADGLKPDLTLLFDLPEKKAAERKLRLNRTKDRLENEKLTFFRKVRK
ncbi:MAG: dTMP kinase, partial [candidate division Zixibacteria bacterium]|nr:dTMP kinase [candidate division Zixibacteria bacterium]NIR67571.1 dTMP kinase [candidate division Zixibacteria bacterium]NIS16138.1 dTMP kinase [candidate division Zixibacteria bacterium]NIS48832.1 dTMP kinase [candidate division Zixibacteria bacterium]NIT52541.1 dTMP kinase [candidate division Zixibacteria bacterium]